jgi:hypothetical protein
VDQAIQIGFLGDGEFGASSGGRAPRTLRFRSEQYVTPRAFVALEMILPGGRSYAARARTVWAREARGEGYWEVGAELLRSGGDADAALAETLLLHAR